MEAFAFLSVFILLLSSPKELKLRLDSRSLFLFSLLAATFICHLMQTDALRESFFLSLLYISAAIALCSYQIKEGSKVANSYFLMIILAGMVNAVVICAQEWDLLAALPFTSAPYNAEETTRPYGNFGQANLAATFVLTSMLCSLYFYKNKKLSGILHTCVLGLGALALAFTASRTAFLALALLVVFSLIIRDWRALLSFLFSAAVIIFTRISTPTDESRPIIGAELSNGRFDLWRIVVDGIMQSPWLGYGAMNTRLAQFSVVDTHPFFRNKTISSAHNIFLDFFAWFGIPIGIIISALFLFMIFSYYKKIKGSSLIYLAAPIIIHSLLEYPLQNANFLFLFIIILGISKNEPAPEWNVRQRAQRLLAYSFTIASTIISATVVYDYCRLSTNYMDLRFFNRHIIGVKRPTPIEPILLDNSIGQFNIFLSNKINSADEAKEVARITPHSPAFRNFLLLAQYYRKQDMKAQETYWVNKAHGYWPTAYMSYIRDPNLTSVAPIPAASAANSAP